MQWQAGTVTVADSATEVAQQYGRAGTDCPQRAEEQAAVRGRRQLTGRDRRGNTRSAAVRRDGR
ncbi:MAG: hypothetical protein WCF33_17845 [Pseudonocardiaceae bacterium]